MSSNHRREKGAKGDQEVAAVFQTAGLDVRGFQRNRRGEMDALVVSRLGHEVYVETKRHERVRLPEWIEQARASCPAGRPWLIAWRRNRWPWFAVQPLEWVAEREARIAELEARVTELEGGVIV